MAPSEKSKPKQRGKPFPKGVSGNPNGRPKGARNKATLAAEKLLDGEAKALTRKAIELAKTGDVTALRLCMDRIVPPRRDRAVTFKLAPITDGASAAGAMASIVAAVATGELTPGEAADVSKLVDTYARIIEISELEKRLAALEKAAA